MRAHQVGLVVVLLAVVAAGCGKAPEDATTGSKAATADTIAFAPPTGTALPNGTVGEVYSQTIAIASGGTAPFTITALELPSGLTWTFESPTGVVTGTPLEPGEGRIRLRAIDGRETMAEATFPVTIEPAGALTVLPSVLPEAALNVPYEATIFASGAQPPCTWMARGELPPGLNLVANAGERSVENELKGTPRTPGTFTFTVTVTDSSIPPRTGSATHTLVVP